MKKLKKVLIILMFIICLLASSVSAQEVNSIRNIYSSRNLLAEKLIKFYFDFPSISYQSNSAVTDEGTTEVEPSEESNISSGIEIGFVEGLIPSGAFKISLGGKDSEINPKVSENWSYKVESDLSTGFKTVENTRDQFDLSKTLLNNSEINTDNYEFDGITVDGVPVVTIGIIRRANGKEVYYYTTEKDNANPDDPTNHSDSNATLIDQVNSFFTLNYKEKEYKIDYQIVIDGLEGGTDEINEDSVFGTDRPRSTYNQQFNFNVTIPYGYLANVYSIGSEESLITDKSAENKNGSYWPLGMEPVYKKDKSLIFPNEENGPKELITSGTYSINKVKEDQIIRVKLEKKTPTFSTKLWLDTDNAGDRGTTVKGRNIFYKDTANCDTVDDWNWRSSKSDLYKEEYVDMNPEPDGTYSYTWTFQTNDKEAPSGYLLDTFEVNGIPIDVPFVPEEIGAHQGDTIIKNSDNIKPLFEGTNLTTYQEVAMPEYSFSKITLVDGAEVTLTYVRVGNFGNTANQRIYELKIENARDNVTVTGANLFQAQSGAPEYSVYSLIGVHADEKSNESQLAAIQERTRGGLNLKENIGWKTAYNASIVIGDGVKLEAPEKTSEDNMYGANIRFKLKDGYTNPAFEYGNIYGKYPNHPEFKIFSSSNKVTSLHEIDESFVDTEDFKNGDFILGPDDDGWYYVRITNFEAKLNVLSVTAEPTNYTIRYLPGEISEATNMPNFQNDSSSAGSDYDTNNGNYYRVTDEFDIKVSGMIPTDPTQNGKVFDHWTVVGADQTVDDPIFNYYLIDADGNLLKKEDQSILSLDEETSTLKLNSGDRAVAVVYTAQTSETNLNNAKHEINLVELNARIKDASSYKGEVYPTELTYTDSNDENSSRNYSTVTIQPMSLDDIEPDWKLYLLDKDGNVLEGVDENLISFQVSQYNPFEATINLNGPTIQNVTALVVASSGEKVRVNSIEINPTHNREKIRTRITPNQLTFDQGDQASITAILESTSEEIIDGDFRLYPNGTFSLSKSRLTVKDDPIPITHYAIDNNDIGDDGTQTKVIRLQAQWVTTPDPFKYNIKLRYLEDDQLIEEDLPIQQVTTLNNYSDDHDKLIVGINTAATYFKNWLSTHPNYRFDTFSNNDPSNNILEAGYTVLGDYTYEVSDDGTIYIYMIRDAAPLTIAKDIIGSNIDSDTDFKFNVYLFESLDNLYEFIESKNENLLASVDINTGTILFTNGQAEFNLKAGESKYANNINNSYYYLIQEENELNYIVDTYSSSQFENVPQDSIIGVITPDSSNYERFVNRVSSGDLVITKKVTGETTDKDFKFSLVLTDNSDETLNGSYTVLLKENSNTIESSVKTVKELENFTLKDGQSLTVVGLPPNTKYQVSEVLEKSNGQVDISVIPNASIDIDKHSASGTIKADSEDNRDNLTSVFFTNKYQPQIATKTGDLYITKNVINEDGTNPDTDDIFEFTITLIPPEGTQLKDNYPYKGENGARSGSLLLNKTDNGSYGKVLLRHGQTIIIEGLPAGTNYSISESSKYDYKDLESKEGKIESNEPSYNTFTNIKEATSSSDLIVSKVVTGNLIEEEKDFEFTLNLEGLDNPEEITFTKTITYETGIVEGNSFSFTLRKNQSIVFTGIPEGTNWEVKEKQEDSYITTVDTSGEIIADQFITHGTTGNGLSHVTYTNHFNYNPPQLTDNTGVLRINKTVSAGTTNDRFLFYVYLESDSDLNTTYPYIGSSSGYLTFELDETGKYKSNEQIGLCDGESVEILGLPDGSNYRVEELPKDTYIVTSNGTDGTIVKNQVTEANFNNSSYTLKEVSSLVIDKTVVGSEDNNDLFDFTVKLTDSAGRALTNAFEYSITEGDTIISTGVLRSGFGFKLKHNQKLLIKNIPYGSRWNVTELNRLGYKIYNQTNDSVKIENNTSIGTVKYGLDKVSFFNYINKKTLNDAEIIVKDDGSVLGRAVQVGDELTYTIFWSNDSGDKAIVTITDKLSDYFDFVGASSNGTYDETDKTVTWDLGSQEPEANGSVTVTVRVNEKALDSDGIIQNQAIIEVGETKVTTNPVENPTVGKTIENQNITITDSNELNGNNVKVGDELTYRIFWANDTEDSAYITVIDNLGDYFDYVSSSDNGSYDESTEIVIWDLGEKEAGDRGSVTVTVRVNENAQNEDNISNDASIKIGESEIKVKPIKNKVVSSGNLEIKKLVFGQTAETEVNDSFDFVVIFDSEVVDGSYVTLLNNETEDSVTFSNGRSDVITLNPNDSLVINELPVGVEYRVVEFRKEGYLSTQATGSSGIIPENATVIATFTNTKTPDSLIIEPNDEGTLTIKKNVVGDTTDLEPFEFTITLSDKAITGTYPIDDSDEVITFIDGVGKIFVNANESKTVSRLPLNINYTVVENSRNYTVVSNGNTGIITNNTLAEFTNTEITTSEGYGSLLVRKELVGEAGDTTKEFTFNITFPDSDKSESFTLKPGESKFFENLPLGSSYTVIETQDSDYQVLDSNEKSGIITDDLEIVFYNKRKLTQDNPIKEELSPGESEIVKLGDLITYRIYWKNDQNTEKAITITDVLDRGLDLVSASQQYIYNSSSRTISWELGNQTPSSSGYVELTVRVNENSTILRNNSNDSNTVLNKATVNNQDTNEVANPVLTSDLTITKNVVSELSIDQEFTFDVSLDKTINGSFNIELKTTSNGERINFTNGKAVVKLKDKESITIKDLPIGINYKVEEREVSGFYNNNPDNFEGKINLENTQVDFINYKDSDGYIPQKTEEQINNKTLTDEDSNNYPAVSVGDEVTYNISFKNEKAQVATITIEDTLVSELDFVSASYGDCALNADQISVSNENVEINYKETDHKVTWTIKNVGAFESGIVTLVARVNNKLRTDPITNRATVQNGTLSYESTTTSNEANTGSLKISKEVKKYELDNSDPEFSFIIIALKAEDSADTNSEVSGSYSISDNKSITFTDGVSEPIKLKAGESVTIIGLPGNTNYKVKESLESNSEYYTDNQEQLAEVVKEETKELKFTNYKDYFDYEPIKTEVRVNNEQANSPLPALKVGDIVEYSIEYMNVEAKASEVIITDQLLNALDFVQASYAELVLNSSNSFNSNDDAQIDFDSQKNTVTWTIKNVKAFGTGKVTLKAKVNSNLDNVNNITNSAQIETRKHKKSTKNVVNSIDKKTLTIQKALSDKSIAKESDKDLEFTFNISLYEDSGYTIPAKLNEAYSGVEFENGQAQIKLKPDHNKDITLPAGLYYQISEVVNSEIFTVSPTYSEGHLVDDITASFTNTRISYQNPTKTVSVDSIESVKVGDTFTYTIGYANNGLETGTITVIDPIHVGLDIVSTEPINTKLLAEIPEDFLDIRDQISYNYDKVLIWTFEDVEPSKGGTITVTVEVTEDAIGDSDNSTVKNIAFVKDTHDTQSTPEPETKVTPKSADLIISKLAAGQIDLLEKDKTFDFVIKLTNPENDLAESYVAQLVDSDGEIIKNDIQVTRIAYDLYSVSKKIGYDQKLVIKGLPVGTSYEISELDTGYEVTATNNRGSIPEQGIVESTFINKLNNELIVPDPEVTGSLTIKKNPLINEEQKEFNFTITLNDKHINGLFGNVLFVNGSAKVSIVSGTEITITGLPVGVTYTVVEDSQGYKSESLNSTGQISQVNITSEFTNTKANLDSPDKGALEIVKEVTGDGDKNREFEFVITLDDETQVIKLRDGQSYVIDNLDIGTSYSIEEINYGLYGVNSDNSVGVINTIEPQRVKFTNDLTLDSHQPVKEEITPSEGSIVKVGDLITYRINWKNDSTENSTITITDILDKGVDFVEASAGANYNEETHTVTWSFDNQAPYAIGFVTLTVKVNNSAKLTGGVSNTSRIVSNDTEIGTSNTVENPILTGNLEISKTVIGDPINKATYFDFTIELSEKLNRNYSGVEFVDGIGIITLKDGESKLIEGLPDSVSYIVSEEELTTFDVTSENEEGIIVGNQTQFVTFTNTSNEVFEPKKEIISPELNKSLKVGDEVVYQISWSNRDDKPGKVIITDKLDEGFDFIEASDNGSYDITTHTVTWDLGERNPEEFGRVTLTVKVNEKALVKGNVENTAQVKVGNNPEVDTNPTSTPVWTPEKTLENSDTFSDVTYGQELIYSITWKNYKDENCNIVIVDNLDQGVDFISATDNGSYDSDTHTVTWNLEDREPGDSGVVKITVKVNEKALENGSVENKASVKVGNDSFIDSNTEESTVWTPEKTIDTDQDTLNIGDELSFDITWKNYHSDKATIKIVDKLDQGFDFVNATNNGVYDQNTHTVTWILEDKEPNSSGKVTIVVRVNQSALIEDELTNRATVQVGNDSEIESNTVTKDVNEFNDPTDKVTLEKTQKVLNRNNNFITQDQEVKSGDIITYKLLISNNRIVNAKDVIVTDPIPGNMELDLSSISTDYTFDSENGILRFDLGSLSPDESAEITYRVTIGKANSETWWINHAYLTYSNISEEDDFATPAKALTNEINNKVYAADIQNTNLQSLTSHDSTFNAGINLNTIVYHSEEAPDDGLYRYSTDVRVFAKPNNVPELTKTQKVSNLAETTDIQVVTRGEELTYYLTVKNPTIDDMTNIIVTDPIATGLEYVESSASNNGQYQNSSIIWKIDRIAAGENLTLSFKVIIPNNENYYHWENTATMNWNENTSNKEQSSNTVVAETPSLEIIKEQSTSGVSNIPRTQDYIEFIPGDVVTYYITVRNVGNVAATNITITDPAPLGMTFIPESASSGVTVENNVLKWHIDYLDPGDASTVEVSFSCELPDVIVDPIYLRNIAYISWDENGSNNIERSNETIIGDPPKQPGDLNTPTPTIPNDKKDPTISSGNNSSNVTTDTTTNSTLIRETNNIVNNATPTNGTSASSPKTGIETNLLIRLIVILIALGILIFNYFSDKKSKNSEMK